MNNNKLLRVGIYLRLSNEDKDKINKEDNSESIKNQRNLLMQYLNNHKEFILIDEYCDEDISGAGTYRPEFERLIEDCKNKKLDIVLCKSQSRFTRDMEIVEKYINNKFIEWNIRFISLSDNADTEIIGNKKSRQINGLVNEWYLEDVSNNIRSAFNSKMKQGEFISPFAPYGYIIDSNNNNKLLIDENASTIVKTIYNLYIKGLGYTSISKYLNNLNIPSPSLYKYLNGIKLNIVSNKPREEIKWNSSAIKKILTNEIYIGNLIQGKRTTISYKNHKIINKDKNNWIKVPNTHTPIIDKYTFNIVQTSIKERTKPIKKTGIIHPFSGKVFCLECNHYMRKKNTKSHTYLTCSNNLDNCNNKSSIRYDDLSNLILDLINKNINKYYDIHIINNLYSKNIHNLYKDKIKILEKEKKDSLNNLTKTKNYLKNLYEDKVNNIITNKQFNYLINNYNKEEIKYEQNIKTINKKIDYYKDKQKRNIYNNYKKIKELNRIIIEEFIDKIYIGTLNKNTNKREIIIKYNF